MAAPKFSTEADLVAAFCAGLGKHPYPKHWTPYHETAGFDLLLVENETGIQVGLEAKLKFNLQVMVQALPESDWRQDGPDYRGIIVPRGEVQHHITGIAQRLGLGVISVSAGTGTEYWNLPDEQRPYEQGAWHPWLPTRRCVLPSYVPDVVGGKPAPVQLTEWKINAIKLLILLDRRGFVTRADMKALRLSQTTWTQPGGYLMPQDGHYVRGARTPDFRLQHPTNWEQIAADFDAWVPPGSLIQGSMLARSAAA